MGGLFSTPKAPPLPAAPPPPGPSPVEETRQARLDALARRRRGRAGTIETSDRGILQPRGGPSGGKRLLGE